jgi:hypothetical protein
MKKTISPDERKRQAKKSIEKPPRKRWIHFWLKVKLIINEYDNMTYAIFRIQWVAMKIHIIIEKWKLDHSTTYFSTPLSAKVYEKCEYSVNLFSHATDNDVFENLHLDLIMYFLVNLKP